MTVLAGVVPVFAVVGVGALARRLGWLDERFVGQLNHLIYNLALPALLVRLIGRTPLADEDLFGPVLLISCAATLLTGLLAWGVMAGSRKPPERLGVVVQAATRGNLAYLAFPLILAVAGEPALRLAAVISAVLIPFQNLLAVAALAAGRGRPPLVLLRTVLVNPVVMGVLGGLLWSLSGWGGWGWLDTFLAVLGAFAMPGGLLALGGQLRLDRLRLDLRLAGFATVLKLAVCPAAGWVAMLWLGVEPLGLLVATLLLAAPTAVVSTAVAQGLGGDTDLAGAAVVVSTLASFPAYLLWGVVL